MHGGGRYPPLGGTGILGLIALSMGLSFLAGFVLGVTVG